MLQTFLVFVWSLHNSGFKVDELSPCPA